jgi:hypothetical protein
MVAPKRPKEALLDAAAIGGDGERWNPIHLVRQEGAVVSQSSLKDIFEGVAKDALNKLIQKAKSLSDK